MSRPVVIGIVIAVALAGASLVAAAIGVTWWLSRAAPEAAAPPIAPTTVPVARPKGPLMPFVLFSLERAPDGAREDPIRLDPPLLRADDRDLVGARTVALPRSGWECRVFRGADTPDVTTVSCLHTPSRLGPAGPQASAAHGWRCETATVSNPLVLSSMDRAGWVDWYVRVECREAAAAR